jgi:hypothetical protein
MRCIVASIALACGVGLPAQAGSAAETLAALARWTNAFLIGRIDVMDPQPLDRDAGPRLPPAMTANNAQRLTELQSLEVLVREVSEVGTPAAAEGLLRLAAVGLDPKSAKLVGAVIVRSVAEEALDQLSSTAVHAFLLEVASRPSKPIETLALRAAAVRALGASGQAVFWPVLTTLLRDSEEHVRATAARALGDLGNPRAIAATAQQLRAEEVPSVMQALALALRDLLALAERDAQLDPLLHRDAIFAVIHAAQRSDDWRVCGDLVRFLDRHRAPEAVPALIEIMARKSFPRPEGEPEGSWRGLQAEAHRVLKAMTGAVLAAHPIERWRELWRTTKDTLKVVPYHREAVGPKATVAGGFFGIPVLGRRVVFVIDVSGSMIAPAPQPAEPGATVAGGPPTRLDIARLECWNAIKDNGADTYFNLVVFSDHAAAWKPDLVPATTGNKTALRNYLTRLRAAGSTNLWAGLATGMSMQTEASSSGQREPVDEVFLLSDGHPSSGEITEANIIVARIGEQNRHAKIRLNTVFIGSHASPLDQLAKPGGGALLQALASANNGRFVAR